MLRSSWAKAIVLVTGAGVVLVAYIVATTVIYNTHCVMQLKDFHAWASFMGTGAKTSCDGVHAWDVDWYSYPTLFPATPSKADLVACRGTTQDNVTYVVWLNTQSLSNEDHEALDLLSASPT
jgi:hypothetical protein